VSTFSPSSWGLFATQQTAQDATAAAAAAASGDAGYGNEIAQQWVAV